MSTPPLNQSNAVLNQRMNDHEKACEERLDGINEKFVDIKEDLKGMRRAMYSVAVGLIGWLAVTVWNGAMDKLSALEHPTQAYSQSKAPG